MTGAEVAQDDRAARESITDFLSGRAVGDGLRPVPEHVLPAGSPDGTAGDGRSVRTRNLRATFRAVPGPSGSVSALDSGFPGSRTFAPRRVDPGAAGSIVQSAPVGPVSPPASAPSPNDLAGRGTAVLAAGGGATADGPAVAADASGGRGRVRRRGTRGAAGDGATTGKQIEASLPLPKAIAKLIPKDVSGGPAPPRVLVPTESERADARRLFREIGERFNVNRKHSKTAAYSGYRHDLMANLDTLVMGGALDLKDATTIITNLEQFTKETEAESTETPATVLGRWLRMDANEVAGLEAGVAESMDANYQLAAEEDEEELEVAEPIE